VAEKQSILISGSLIVRMASMAGNVVAINAVYQCINGCSLGINNVSAYLLA